GPKPGARYPSSGRMTRSGLCGLPDPGGPYPAPRELPSTTGRSGDPGDTPAAGRTRCGGWRACGCVRDRAQARARRRLLVLVCRLRVQARADAELLLDLLLDLVGEIGVVAQEVPRVL